MQVYARNPRKEYIHRTHVASHPVKIATPPCQGSNKPLEKMILDATLLMLMPPNLKTRELKLAHSTKVAPSYFNYPSEMICFLVQCPCTFWKSIQKPKTKNTEVLAASD